LAREGGLQSTLWAGPESIPRSVQQGDFPAQGTTRDKPVSLSLGFASDEFGYLIDLGLPAAATTAFQLDPAIKQECVWHGAKRKRASAPRVRDSEALISENEVEGDEPVSDVAAALRSNLH